MALDLESLSDVIAMAVKDATASLLERLAVAETKLAIQAEHGRAVTELRDRLVVVETKSALMAAPSEGLTERLAALESKRFALAPPSPGPELEDVQRRLLALEQRPSPPDVSGEVSALRDRITGLEGKADRIEERLAAPNPLGPAVEKAEHHLVELSKDLGALRERVAVAEVKQGTPGPPGPAGKDGRDGVDGFGFDDLMLEQTDERSFAVKAARGERVKTIGMLRIPAQIQRGVWVEGKQYERGDVVTFGGSQFCANETTADRPETSKAWTLVVKRGRDGRDGKDAAGPLPVVKVNG